MRRHIYCDATGLSPAVASVFLHGFEAAAEEVSATIAATTEAARGLAVTEATEVTLGEGKVDITRIEHEGRVGVLFAPRAEHIAYDEPGVIQEGKHWPKPGDVVLWVSGAGPQVAIDAIREAALRTSPSETVGGGDRRPFKMLVDRAQLREMIAADPDGDCEAGDPSFRAALSSAPPAEETWQATTGRLYEEPCLGWSPYTGTVVVRGTGGWTTITHSRPLPPAPAGESK